MIRTQAVAPSAGAEVLAPFDYRSLSPPASKLAKAAAEYIIVRQRSTTRAILEIGQKLIEVKDTLDHGQFAGWLEAEFGWSDRSARNYMMAAKSLGEKTETVSVLPVTTVYELARASAPVREKVIERMSAETLPAEAVRGLISEERKAERDAFAEARKTPEQKRKDRARKLRDQKEREDWHRKVEERRAAEEAANSRVAVMLIGRFGTGLPELVKALDGATFGNLKGWLEYPYGFDVVGFQKVARPKPEQ